jgi:hypothetical protein
VEGDQRAGVEDALGHDEHAVHRLLDEDTTVVERARSNELLHGGGQLPPIGGSADPGRAGPYGGLDEDREGGPVGHRPGVANHHRPGLGHPGPLEGPQGRHLVLHLDQGGERRHGRGEAGLGQSGELMREHGDLLLGGKDHVDPGSDRRLEQPVEPLQGLAAELRHPVQRADVVGEAGQAERVGYGRRHLVSQLVQPGGHLTAGQSGAFGQEDSHGIGIQYIYMAETKKNPASSRFISGRNPVIL